MPTTTPLPIDLVEPCAAAPAGDRLPCHLLEPAVSWPVPPDAVLRPDAPPRAFTHAQVAAAMQRHIDEGLAYRRARRRSVVHPDVLAPVLVYSTVGLTIACACFAFGWFVVPAIIRALP